MRSLSRRLNMFFLCAEFYVFTTYVIRGPPTVSRLRIISVCNSVGRPGWLKKWRLGLPFWRSSFSSLGHDVDCPGRVFSSFSLVPPGNCLDNTLKLCRDCFLSHSFQVIIIFQSSDAIYFELPTASLNNNNNNYYYYYVTQKEAEKRLKYNSLCMYRDTANVEHEMYDYTGNNWSHRNCNKRFKDKFGSHTRKTVDRSTTKDSCTSNITHNTESTAVWNLKTERWWSLLVQEKYRGEKACDRRHHNNNNNNNNILLAWCYRPVNPGLSRWYSFHHWLCVLFTYILYF
jgi:hypothetical protein